MKQNRNINQKIWIFIIEQNPSDIPLKQIEDECLHFIQQWTSHNHPLNAEFELFKERLLIFKNNEEVNPIGGCATDQLFHFIQDLEKKYNLNLLNRQLVVYENNNELNVCSLNDVEHLLQNNSIHPHTIIYDTSIIHSSEWDKFRKVLTESWLNKVLQLH